MADFSANATGLSQPSAAGANPVAPVQEQAVNTFPGALLETVGSIFVKGLEQNNKDQKEKLKNSVVSAYSKELKNVNDALEGQKISPTKASAMTMAINSKYQAGYSEYTEDFAKVSNFLKGNTAVGQAIDAEKADQDFFLKRREFAQSRGVTFVAGESKDSQIAKIEAAETTKRYDDKLASLYRQREEERATRGAIRADSAESREQFNFEEKRIAVDAIREVAGVHVAAFQKHVNGLADQVKSGRLPPEEAQKALVEYYSHIKSGISSAARSNPGLASAWDSTFQSMYDMGQKLIDPKNTAENTKAQFDEQVNKGKLLALQSSPQAYAAIVTDKLFTNPTVTLNIGTHVSGIVSELSQMSPDAKWAPPVVGNKTIEADALKLLKGGLSDLNTGKNKETGAKIQASNSVSHILKQTGELISKGDLSYKDLDGLADFFASAEYGKWRSANQPDPQAETLAAQVFTMNYKPAIEKGVMNKMEEPLFTSSGPQGRGFSANAGNSKASDMKIGDVVDVKFSGAGVVFVPKGTPGRDIELRSQTEALKRLNATQSYINKVIRMGAHLEGTTNYSQYWEAHKHELLPNMFAAPVETTTKPQPKQAASKPAGGSNWWEQ